MSQPFDIFFSKQKATTRNKGTWEESLLFTALLPLGSAPESLRLGVKFVTEAVAQVTTWHHTVRLSPSVLTELFSYLLAFPAHDYLCKSGKLVRGHWCWALICTLA